MLALSLCNFGSPNVHILCTGICPFFSLMDFTLKKNNWLAPSGFSNRIIELSKQYLLVNCNCSLNIPVSSELVLSNLSLGRMHFEAHFLLPCFFIFLLLCAVLSLPT
jgi:hypothetical protein